LILALLSVHFRYRSRLGAGMPPEDPNRTTTQAQGPASTLASRATQPAQPVQAAAPARRVGAPFEEGRAELSPEEQARKKKEREESNRKVYEEELGKWLGDQVYSLLAKELSSEKIGKHAQKGADSLLDLLAKQADKYLAQAEQGGVEGASNAGQLVDALRTYAAAESEKYLASPDGQELALKVNQWLETHPKTVVTLAILAAVTAVVANVDIPELKQKFNLGAGFGLEAGAKLGKIRDIALKSVQASLKYEHGGFKAELKGGHEKKDDGDVTTAGLSASLEGKGGKGELQGLGEWKSNGDFTLKAGLSGTSGLTMGSLSRTWKRQEGKDTVGTDLQLKYGDDARSLSSNARFLDDGSMELKLDGGLHRSGLDLTAGAAYKRDAAGKDDVSAQATGRWGTEQNNLHATAGYGSGGLTAGLGQTYTANGVTLTRDPIYNRDAAGTERSGTRTDMSYAQGSTALRLRRDEYTGGGSSTELGVKYDASVLVAALDAKFGQGGADALSGSLERKSTDGWVAKGDFKLDLRDPGKLELGAMFGFRDPKAFEGFLLEYRRGHAGTVPTDQFNATLEHTLGDFYLRARTENKWQGGSFNAGRVEAQALYPVSDKLGILGGVAQGYGPQRAGGTELQLGVQYNKIPVYLKYDLERKSFGVGITIPLGR
jgi:hypothetical protein